MLKLVFAVFDSKVGAYLTPFFLRSKGEAERAFAEASMNSDSNFAKWPGDYSLFLIGSYKEDTGELKRLPVFESLGTALEFKSRFGRPTLDEVSRMAQQGFADRLGQVAAAVGSPAEDEVQ